MTPPPNPLPETGRGSRKSIAFPSWQSMRWRIGDDWLPLPEAGRGWGVGLSYEEDGRC